VLQIPFEILGAVQSEEFVPPCNPMQVQVQVKLAVFVTGGAGFLEVIRGGLHNVPPAAGGVRKLGTPTAVPQTAFTFNHEVQVVVNPPFWPAQVQLNWSAFKETAECDPSIGTVQKFVVGAAYVLKPAEEPQVPSRFHGALQPEEFSPPCSPRQVQVHGPATPGPETIVGVPGEH